MHRFYFSAKGGGYSGVERRSLAAILHASGSSALSLHGTLQQYLLLFDGKRITGQVPKALDMLQEEQLPYNILVNITETKIINEII